MKAKVKRSLIAGVVVASTILVLSLASSACNRSSPDSAPPSATPTPDPVSVKLKRMSLEEKVGQLFIVGIEGASAGELVQSLVRNDHAGGFILYKENIVNTEQTTSLLNELKRMNADQAAPLFLSIDQEGGRVDRLAKLYSPLPSSRDIGKSGKTELSTEIGARLGEELKELGFNMNFAPVLDVDSNPKNPVIGDRSFGAAPELVSRMGIAAMKSMRDKGVVPVVKHFPGHGDTSVDSHLALPRVDKSIDDLRRLELVPFTEAIGQKADAVMVAHILLPKVDAKYPASLSKALITNLLRGELRYDGVVITDDLTMGAVLQNYNLEEAAVLAVEAGADIVLVSHGGDKAKTLIQAMVQNVKVGKIPISRIDESVYRILKLKESYRLSDKPVVRPDVEGVKQRINDMKKAWGTIFK